MAAIGELDQFIAFEAESVCEDGFGGGHADWGTHARAWAKIVAVRGSESEREGALRATSTYMIEMWQDGLEGVTEAMRINWDGLFMNIREIRRPPHRAMMMTIIAESGVTL
jgi:head-tail adaptor